LALREVVNQLRDTLADNEIHQCEVSGEDEHSDDDDGGRGLDLRARGRNYLAHLAAHVLEELNQFPGSRLEPIHPAGLLFVCHCNRLRHGAASNLLAAGIFCRGSCLPNSATAGGSGFGKLAGELGFEPRSSVLETDSLTFELTPPKTVGIERPISVRTNSRGLLSYLVSL